MTLLGNIHIGVSDVMLAEYGVLMNLGGLVFLITVRTILPYAIAPSF